MRFLNFTLFILTLSACTGIRYLKEEEKLLYKQKISGGKVFDRYELENLYVRKSNNRFPPYSLIYQWGLNHFDTARYTRKKISVEEKYAQKIKKAKSEKAEEKYTNKKIREIQKIDRTLQVGNYPMQWGETLALFDSLIIQESANNFNQYMFNHGYFNSKVETVTKPRGKGKRKSRQMKVHYLLNEGKPYTIDSLFFETDDSVIYNILYGNRTLPVKTGDIYNQNSLITEREKIEFILKDNGYYNFSRQYIRYELDSGYGKPYSLALKIKINNPANYAHKQYSIDSVNFIVRHDPQANVNSGIMTSRRNGVVYSLPEKLYSDRILAQRIFLSKDSLYNRSSTIHTQLQLANLDNFKFININYDSTGGSFIANIFTRPLDRYQWVHELGVNVTQGFPGPFYNLTFKKRNIFRGLENFEINARLGIEGVATPGDITKLYNREVGINASLIFPQFLMPANEGLKNKFGKYNPKTRLLAGFTDTDRFDYRRKNINFSNTYSWQASNTLFSLVLPNVSIINTSYLSPNFLKTLENLHSRLINSFKPSYVSNMALSLQRASSGGGFTSAGNSLFYKLLLESGGTSLNAFGTEYIQSQGLEYYKYLKFDFDFHNSKPLVSSSSLAYRVNIGLAKPYSKNNILPYEKYLFAGGSNGIRAWRPRRLGPGSYTPIDSVSRQVSYSLEQQGEIILQAGLEFRRKLIGFVDYALFIDAGNIWTIQYDSAREGSQFKMNRFYKEIALGTGFGLRFDFSFLILRLDTGLKTLDPARDPGKRFILSKGFTDPPFQDNKKAEMIVFSIGVGYPF
ncbi:MAG: BamA/TamA family outer membrane protein [Cyclobacteriaceae bacterium]|nr:BamA/TamA family outer membrane protein [Cyclobacteriaceae bacterium]